MVKFLEALYEQLSVYVRFTAWLNTAPERAEGDKSSAKIPTRIEALREDQKDEDYEPEMPAVDAEYLVKYLFEAGPVSAGAMGASVLSHSEIKCFARNMGISLHPFEARFIRKLSMDYLTASRLAEKRDCPPPWEEATVGKRLTAKSFKESLIEMEEL